MPEAPVPIDVVVLTWNDGNLLARAVGSAAAETVLAVQVIVVDNGSEQPLSLPELPTMKLIRNETNRGVAVARNQGAGAGVAPLICFLDSDAQLTQGSLARLAEVVLGDAAVAMAAPVFIGQEPEASGGRAPTASRKLRRVLGLADHYAPVGRDPARTVWDVDFAIGACQVIRRAVFEGIGGLDESYFYGPEDVDFCLRVREAGWRVVQVGDAPVEHPPRRRNRRLLTRNGVRHAWAVCRHLWRHRNFERRCGRGVSRTSG